MSLVIAALDFYTLIVLTVTGAVSEITGLYPAEQLAYVQKIHNIPESAGVIDTAISIVRKEN